MEQTAIVVSAGIPVRNNWDQTTTWI